jgi:hypothetical protein
MTNKLLYDLGVALGSISLWLSPWNETKILGYALSISFSSRAYYTGLMTLQAERKNDEKEAIAYEADVDFTDQLLGTHVDAQLEIKELQIENIKLQQLLPLVRINQQLQQQLQTLQPVHPELTDEDREQAAKQAINNAFTEVKEVDEDAIRKHFPELMDSTSWKAILKALQSGSNKEEIVKDVLGSNNETGRAYFDFLKRKYLG